MSWTKSARRLGGGGVAHTRRCDRRDRSAPGCLGASACERRKIICGERGGSSTCENDLRRNGCKECLGSSNCPHKRIKSRCKGCEGSKICEHNRRGSQCKDCGCRSVPTSAGGAGTGTGLSDARAAGCCSKCSCTCHISEVRRK